jgi:hypothetical protein
MFLVQMALLAAGLVAGSIFLAPVGSAGLSPGLGTFLGLIVLVALMAVMLFLTIRWSFTGQAVMVESAGPLIALRRSWHLVAGSGWRVLGYVLGFGLLVGLIAGLLGAVFALLVNPIRLVGLTQITIDAGRLAISTFIASVISSVVVPIPAIALTLLYFDLRFRKGEQAPQPGETR